MIINCEGKYNNGRYGKGKAYIAKIVGRDDKYIFKREFIDKNTTYKNNSKTTWYDYFWEIDEDGIYEWDELERRYFKYDKAEDDIVFLDIEEVLIYINNI